jgi:integrase
MQGESLGYIKEQMGHSSIQVMVDLYGHLVPGSNRQAVDRLDDERSKEKDVQPSATNVQPKGSKKQKGVTLCVVTP